MDRTTALGAAAGVTLAVVGAVSALFLTIDQPSDAAQVDVPATVEYVDSYGNPVAPPVAAAASPQVVLLNADGSPVEAASPEPAAEPAEYEAEVDYEDHEAEYEEGEEEYEAEEYEEEEYGEGEEYEEEEEEDEDYEDDEEEEDEDEDEDYEGDEEEEYEDDDDDD